MIKFYKIIPGGEVSQTLMKYLDDTNNGVTKFREGNAYIYIVDTSICDITDKIHLFKSYECELKNKFIEDEFSKKEIDKVNKLKEKINKLEEDLETSEEYITYLKTINRNIENEKEEGLKDTLEYYKDDINKRVEELAGKRFDELRQHFTKNEFTYDELCELYKEKIKGEIAIRLKTKNDDFSYSEADRKIREYKNKIVDEIVNTTLAKRSERDFHLIMQRARKLADTIEEFIWSFKI